MMPAYWAAMPRMPPVAGLVEVSGARSTERLAACSVRTGAGAGAGAGLGFGFGFGLAVALKPMTPNAVCVGAAAAGACTAAGTEAAVVVPVEGFSAAEAACAGIAKAATRPPEAARTAEVLTAGWAHCAAMPVSSVRGLKRPGAR